MNIRQYYILLRDACRSDLEVVEDYETGDFDVRGLWNGKAADISALSQLRFSLSDGESSDLLGNPLSLLIVSDRLRRIFLPYTDKYVQFCPIAAEKGKKKVCGYYIANPLGTVDAADVRLKTTEGFSVNQLILSSSRIPGNRHLFRLKSEPLVTVISQELSSELSDSGLAGLASLKVKMVK